jgi:membrane fusion protein (multidrug efflux system)
VRGSAEALSVPAIAVIPELGGKKVFVLEDGKAVSRPVETGIRTASRVEIVEGLEAGEQVIVSNVARVTAGVEVVVRDEEEAL